MGASIRSNIRSNTLKGEPRGRAVHLALKLEHEVHVPGSRSIGLHGVGVGATKVHWFTFLGSLQDLTTGLIWLVTRVGGWRAGKGGEGGGSSVGATKDALVPSFVTLTLQLKVSSIT